MIKNFFIIQLLLIFAVGAVNYAYACGSKCGKCPVKKECIDNFDKVILLNEKKNKKDLALEVCPVTDEQLKEISYVNVTYKGETYGFCSIKCRKTFSINPEKYLKEYIFFY